MSESSSKPKYPKAPHKHIHKKMRKTLFVAPTSVLVSRLSVFHLRPAPPIFEFNTIFGSRVKMKRDLNAITLFKHMHVKGIVGIVEPGLGIFKILVSCSCHLGHMKFAFFYVTKVSVLMVKIAWLFDKTVVIMYNTIIDSLCKNNVCF
ncbi:hypothetical protein GmHk_16G045844 [Glycine max]|nr:hypothetical protein GmHk_16G045844 [Glycine max]